MSFGCVPNIVRKMMHPPARSPRSQDAPRYRVSKSLDSREPEVGQRAWAWKEGGCESGTISRSPCQIGCHYSVGFEAIDLTPAWMRFCLPPPPEINRDSFQKVDHRNGSLHYLSRVLRIQGQDLGDLGRGEPLSSQTHSYNIDLNEFLKGKKKIRVISKRFFVAIMNFY
ncbi:hypothetical protein CDAR_211781 [Caerostris darwini]|uniref:Uncharacterized protein n=1 Tax=Caerostris darwini TaxID=1538125 RepID=A0AAV4PFH6_9ARAC|nr:hypothetical protein CDAR_211781 [Caerostris darwini]